MQPRRIVYTNFSPSPPTGVGVNRIDGVKPTNKEVTEQTALGDFSQALSTQRAPTIGFDDARAIRDALNSQSQNSAANTPFTASQLLEYISKNAPKVNLPSADTADNTSDSNSEDNSTDSSPNPANAKKEKQAKQFLDVANFSSNKNLFEIVV